MALCIIADKLIVPLADGTFSAGSGTVKASPVTIPQFTNLGLSGWVEEQAADRESVADGTGAWSIKLPRQDESDPATQQWIIALPDGTKFQGAVPNADGPFTVKALKDSHGWIQISPRTAS